MAIPQMGGVLGLVLYNLVDTFYIGMLGPVPLAAISFTFPVVMIVGAIAQGLAQGASALISRTIGQGDGDTTRRLATHAMIMALGMVILVASVGLSTIDPLFRLLGAGDDVLPLIREYMEVWYLGVMFIIVTMVGNNILRSTGEVKLPGVIMLVAAGLNALLDPLFIFGLGPFPALGIRGAALATALARSITLLVSLYLLVFREHLIHFGKGGFREFWTSFKDISFLGVPIMATRLIVPLGAGVVTRIVSQFGTPAVAGYGVAHRIEIFALSFVNSLSIVLSPFVGQNIGAGRLDRVKQAFTSAAKFSFWVGGLSFLVLLAIPQVLVGFFNQDPLVVSTGSLYLRIVSVAYAFQGLYMVIVAGLNVLKRPFSAGGLGFFQMFGLTIPLSLLFSHFWGLAGLFTALALSYFISGVTSWLVLQKVLSILDKDLEGTDSFPIETLLESGE